MNKKAAEYSEKEAQERFEKALRGGLKTSPKPLKDVPKKERKTGKGPLVPTSEPKSS